jgi:hypothetical protein
VGVLPFVGVALAGTAGWMVMGGDPAGPAMLPDTVPLPWAAAAADLDGADGSTSGGVLL